MRHWLMLFAAIAAAGLGVATGHTTLALLAILGSLLAMRYGGAA